MPPTTKPVAAKPASAKTDPKTEPRREPNRESSANRPVHEIRLGRIRAAIWANPTETGVRYNTTLCRLYKDDKSGEWRDSLSFGRYDLPLVMKVADLAMLWIYEHGISNNGDK
jgi:hypothetical protein